MLHNLDSLKQGPPFPKAEIGPKTAQEHGVAHGDDVVVRTDRGEVKMKAQEGVVLVPYGWWGDANCNLLTDCRCREPIMGYPQWKGLLCSISKA